MFKEIARAFLLPVRKPVQAYREDGEFNPSEYYDEAVTKMRLDFLLAIASGFLIPTPVGIPAAIFVLAKMVEGIIDLDRAESTNRGKTVPEGVRRAQRLASA